MVEGNREFKEKLKAKLMDKNRVILKGVDPIIPSKQKDTFAEMSNEELNQLQKEVEILETKPIKTPQSKRTEKRKQQTIELEKNKESEQIIEDVEIVENYPMIKNTTPLDTSIRILPPENEVREMIKRYKFVKSELVDKNDFVAIKGKPYLKKSGYRKFVNAFGISVELMEMNVYELMGDWHAEVRLKVSVPSGQTVEGIGICSWNELHTKTLHNLKATAWTRAFNRGIADLVAYGEVSAEEITDITKPNLDDDF